MLQQVNKTLPKVYFILLIVFFISLFCTLRAVSSLCTMALVAVALVGNRLNRGRWWNPAYINLWSVGCALFFLLQIVALLYTNNMSEGMRAIQLKSALVATPILTTYLVYISRGNLRRLMIWYVYLLLAATLYCLVNAIVYYASTGSTALFFYHPLVSVYNHHAVLYSILVFVAIAFLKESFNEKSYLARPWLHLALIFYFAIFLLLLSSKLIIVITTCYFLYELLFRQRFKHSRKRRFVFLAFITAAALVLIFVKNPISARFISESTGKIAFIKQEKFTPGDYFTGTQFRLLQWRFTYEILTENKRWWIGVSPGDAQEYLDKKYISDNMFIGGRVENPNGFLGYNTHDQYLQSALGNGIIGLAVFLMVCASMIKMAVQKKDIQLSFLVIVLLAYSFSESVFETQYDLMVFTFFPLLLYYRAGKDPEKS